MAQLSNVLACALAVCFVASILPEVESARILVVISMPAPSHMIVFTALTRALAEHGHNITLVAPAAKAKKLMPTHNHVIVDVHDYGVEAYKRQSVAKFTSGDKGDVITSTLQFFNWGPQLVRTTLTHPNYVAEINKPGQKFDLVITEAFFLQEAMVALGHKFNAPVVALNPFGSSPQVNEVMGNPMNPAWTPNVFLGLPDRMTFTERTLNFLASTAMNTMYHILQLPKQQALVEEFFPGAPSVQELLRHRLALVLVNNHFSLSYPVPMVPGVVEVGGMHIANKPKPLPKDLKDVMDNAKEGVVYFSMGSNLLMEYVPKEKMLAIFNALGSLKQRVLMKWDGAVPDAGVPKNIKILDWAPQADLLAHPNLRAFVTHGGLLSTQESVYNAVPLVGIPVFADQEFNMGLATKKGFCQKVDYVSLTEDKLKAALNEVINNPKYKESASLLSRLFRSKPMSPVDLAVFWVEHVIEHGGAHLRPASVDVPLYQTLLLDVMAAILLPIILLLYIIVAICRCCCCGRRKAASAPADQKKKKKKNQ